MEPAHPKGGNRGTPIAWMVGVSVARRSRKHRGGPLALRPRPASGHAEGPCGESAARVRVSKRRGVELHAWPCMGHASPAEK
jgi:hypothetical protein